MALYAFTVMGSIITEIAKSVVAAGCASLIRVSLSIVI
tara:strand:+ start:1175 stop:1288 length:114 start_codon:yes stop_codon:yes gene_type:complete